MNEINLFNLEAQVYILDKNQKWSPLTVSVVPVSFLQNPTTRVTRICAYRSTNSKELVVNSEIQPSMQYRRPTETFVQWFDSQNVLYGLNLTSVTDAEGFQREFDYATGRKQRDNQSTPPGSKSPQAANNQQKAPSSNPRPGGADGPQTPFDSELKAKLNKSLSKMDISAGGDKQAPIKKSSEGLHNSQNHDSYSPASGAKWGEQQSARKNVIERSASDFAAGGSPDAAGTKSGEDAKTISQLKSKIKELEMQNITLTADNAALQETVASQAKNVSSLNQQIESMQADLDKLRAGFQQNATSAGLWKQKLEDYQRSNDALTLKIQQLRELYAKFGDILRPGAD